MKYRLYFKTASKYRGKITGDLGAIVLRLIKNHNIPQARESNFYIMAPPAMFTDYVTAREKIDEALRDVSSDTKRFFESMKDPAIFYKIDEKHFLLVKQWGKDFTPIRRFIGLLTANLFGIYAFFAAFMMGTFYTSALAWRLASKITGDSPSWNLVPATILFLSSIALIIVSAIVILKMTTTRRDRTYKALNFTTEYQLKFSAIGR